MTQLTSMKISESEGSVEKPSYMAYPEWLDFKRDPFKLLYTSEAAMKQHYVLFFLKENIKCQVMLTRPLVDKISHILSHICNEYDYSLAGLNFTKSQVEQYSNQWLQRLEPLVRTMIADDFGLHIVIKEGHPPFIKAGIDLLDMFEGKVPEDFLFKHVRTEKAFTGYTITQRMLKLQNPPR